MTHISTQTILVGITYSLFEAFVPLCSIMKMKIISGEGGKCLLLLKWSMKIYVTDMAFSVTLVGTISPPIFQNLKAHDIASVLKLSRPGTG